MMTLTGRLMLLSTAVAMLFGCGMVSDMAETQKKSEAIALALEKELGVKPMVGWNIHNGTLTHVNVQFPLEGGREVASG